MKISFISPDPANFPGRIGVGRGNRRDYFPPQTKERWARVTQANGMQRHSAPSVSLASISSSKVSYTNLGRLGHMSPATFWNGLFRPPSPFKSVICLNVQKNSLHLEMLTKEKALRFIQTTRKHTMQGNIEETQDMRNNNKNPPRPKMAQKHCYAIIFLTVTIFIII